MNRAMAESKISEITLVKSKEEYSSDENIEINVQFSIEGGLRNAFNEVNWTKAYNNNDVSMKLQIWCKINIWGIQKERIRENYRFIPKSCNFLDKESKISQSNER